MGIGETAAFPAVIVRRDGSKAMVVRLPILIDPEAAMSKVAHDSPSSVIAHQGEVQIDGPGCTALSMTPNAAIETADRLLEAATTAHGQRILAPARDGQM